MQQHVRDYTELCLKDPNGMYTVQVDAIGMHIGDLIELVIKPTLLAAGYDKDAVDEALYRPMPVVDEQCPYKPELEKILDALHCDNMQQAIQKINKMKQDITVYRVVYGPLKDV